MEGDIRATEKHYTIQKKEWVAFRVFWTFMSLVIIAALFGLFGSGLLSNKSYSSNGTVIEYQKFMRVEKGTTLLIHFTKGGNRVQVGINNDYLKKVRIEQVMPEPLNVELKNRQLLYTFRSVQNGFVIFYLNPQKMGRQQLQVNINGRQMHFNQYIYF